jgi:hypothetical protein
MSRLSSLLIVCAALSAGTGLAQAGTCADQISQLMFAAALAEAEALNAEGNEAECLLAAGRAKQMRELG